MAAASGVRKYLARWAEPEAAEVGWLTRRYHAGLVVPAFGEDLALLDGYRPAAQAALGRVLVVLVVNQAPSAAGEPRAATERLLAQLRERTSERRAAHFLLEEPEFDLLVVDRASPGRELDEKLGVGHARKIGADVLLALTERGQLELPFICSTDADVSLPRDYFARVSARAGTSASALIFPFQHVRGAASADVFESTELYELTLRYHVLGLAAAGSPYAYHSMGSALVAQAGAYAGVRGFPKRAAGEDFYLLDKLGKLGVLERLSGEPISIHARRSARAPFGTGPRVEQLLRDASAPVDHPLCYRALGLLLSALDTFAEKRTEGVFEQAFAALPEEAAQAASIALARSRLVDAARSAVAEVGTGDLRRRLHTWFDALRSLRFLHAIGELGFPKIPIREALMLAPFTRLPPDLPLAGALSELNRLEAVLPYALGPAATRAPT